ncbi:multi-sensor domain-containing diguanylate cyclase [Malaciobacter halophilus]|uniref:diguanylate cyclase domain-containing protein n=1 Tax=Malaciobacter halophilus TaxID=197482 RepID=UPI000E109E79|nr:diguanylate cyclase [Malaciobacter halophilus]AXH09096.1 multi-sensor domain-containing diguanylate cyclase [Malaciobacter halophilus]
MLKNSLFAKILLIFTLPALGILYFSTVLVLEKIDTLSEVDNIQSDIEYIFATEKVIDSIQKERGYTVIYLNSQKYKNRLLKQRESTNEVYHDFLSTIAKIQKNTPKINFTVKKIQDIFKQFSLLRQKVDNNNIKSSDAILSYSNINKALLETIYSIKPIKFATKFNTKFSYIVNILAAKEAAGVERALTSILIVQKDISLQNYKKLIRTYAIQDFNIEEFLLKAEEKEIEVYNKIIKESYNQRLKNIRTNLKELISSDSLSLDSWWNLSSARIDNLGKLHYLVSSDVLKLAKQIEKEATKSQILSLSFLFVSFVTLISLLFVLKTIVSNQQRSFNKLKKQQNIYKALNKINKVILKMNTKKRLFNKVLDTIVSDSNISLGVIYKVKKSQRRSFLIKGESYKEAKFKLVQPNNSILKKSILSKKNIIKNSNIDKYSDLDEDFIKSKDFKSLAVFPIQKFGKVTALLVLYSNKKGFFDNEIEILFNKMIIDMEYALEKIDYEKTKAKQEERLTIASYAFESNEPMIITNSEARIIDVNQAFCNVMGYEKDDILGQNPNIFKSEEHSDEFYSSMWNSILSNGTWSGEIYNKKKNGENIPLKATITAIKEKDGSVKNYLSQYNDISEQKLKQQYLEYQATHDSLTALPNRMLLFDRVKNSINKVTRHKSYGAIIFIDLDNFKTINDTLGHETGDVLLKEVARKLQNTVRKEDTIARIGGDEFIVLADFIGNDKPSARNNIQILASKIKGSLNDIKTINGYENISTPSIGITLFRDSTFSVKELIKQADTAMYMAKRSGKNTIAFFE